MIHTVIFLLVLAGFAMLFFAMKRHQQDWLGRKLSATRTRGLRIIGFAALGLAFILCGARLGWGYGTLSWFGWMTVSALLVVIANSNREAIQRRLPGGAR